MIKYLFKEEKEIKSRGASPKEDDVNLLEDTLDGFLSSSLNTELVYVILKGITSFVSTVTSPGTAKRNPSNNSTSETEGSPKTAEEEEIDDYEATIKLDKIIIPNFISWENCN